MRSQGRAATWFALLASAPLLLGSPRVHAGAEEGDLAVGRKIYNDVCRSCHGDTGDGRGPASDTLNPRPTDFSKGEFRFGGTDEDLFAIIEQGAGSRGGSPSMGEWGVVITALEPRNVLYKKKMWSLVKYIRCLNKVEPMESCQEAESE